MSVSLSFQTDPRTREDLDRIADAVERNRDWVINEAVSNYIELHEWQLREIEKGIADSDAGRTLSHEEVCARIRRAGLSPRRASAPLFEAPTGRG